MRYSTLAKFLKCGLAYRYSLEDQHRRTTVSLSQGIAAAKGAREDNLSRIESDTALPDKDVVEVAVASYEQEVSEAEVMAATASDVGQGKDITARIAQHWCIGPRVQLEKLIAAEAVLRGRIGVVQVTGTPDYITAAGIGDLKTGLAWSQEKADRARQLTIYALLHEQTYGTRPQRLWIDSIASRKKVFTYERIWTQRTEADYAAIARVMEAADAGIRQGVFLPAAEGSWWCDPRYCEHWLRCEAVIGRSVPEYD